jgi:hypothetical protein
MATGDKVLARERLQKVISFCRPIRDMNRKEVEFVVTELEKIEPLLHSASPLNRAPVTSRAVDDELYERLRKCAIEHPDWSRQKIGRHFGVDGGRVTEAVQGIRRRGDGGASLFKRQDT